MRLNLFRQHCSWGFLIGICHDIVVKELFELGRVDLFVYLFILILANSFTSNGVFVVDDQCELVICQNLLSLFDRHFRR